MRDVRISGGKIIRAILYKNDHITVMNLTTTVTSDNVYMKTEHSFQHGLEMLVTNQLKVCACR